MYAHLEKAAGRRGHSEDGPAPRVAGQRGLLGSLTFRQLAGAARVCLTLWETEASATAYLGRRAGLAALPGEVYEVTAAEDGPASAQAPAWARLMYFDGPRAPEQAAAADRAGRQRIWPAISGLSGLVSAYVLHGRDLGAVIITLTTSVETLDAAERAAMSTELMPGEDPALLPGPDRIEIHHVTGYQRPAATAASMKGR
jgi:hypothetical protein